MNRSAARGVGGGDGGVRVLDPLESDEEECEVGSRREDVRDGAELAEDCGEEAVKGAWRRARRGRGGGRDGGVEVVASLACWIVGLWERGWTSG